MKTVALDVHTGRTQISVSSPDGDILLEKIVETKADCLRREIGAIQRPKRVVFENGHLSAMIVDAVQGVAEEVISCDPTKNALVARADDSNDRQDARRLGTLARANALSAVFVPPEPFRALRALTCYETRLMSEYMTRIKALCRRHSVPYKGKGIYWEQGRQTALLQFSSQAALFQIGSLYRVLETLHKERLALRRQMPRMTKAMPVFQRIMTVAGVGDIVARVLVVWIVDPSRFKSRSALFAYSGLGLKQNITNWQATQRARASRRGQREIKRVLFLGARAAIRWNKSALARRYRARIESGWEDRKAIRDVARTLLSVAIHVWKTGEVYDDAKVSVPVPTRAR